MKTYRIARPLGVYRMEGVQEVPQFGRRIPIYDAVWKRFMDGPDDVVRTRIDGKSTMAVKQSMMSRAMDPKWNEGLEVKVTTRGDFIYMMKQKRE